MAQPAQTAQSEQRQDTGVSAELLRTGWGRTLLILAGVLAVAAGVETGRRSVRLDFRERFTAAHMPRALAILTRALGAVGCVARAVVFVVVGVFLLKAAVLSSANRPRGWTRSSVRWPAPPTVPGCWPGSHPAFCATACTACSKPATATSHQAAEAPLRIPAPVGISRAPDSCRAGRRETPRVTDRGQRSAVP